MIHDYEKIQDFNLITKILHTTRYRNLETLIKRLSRNNNDLRIVDVGCGVAKAYNLIKRLGVTFHYVGIEIREDFSELARTRYGQFENFEIIPDIIITGKGLGGGMPIGAFMTQRHIMDLLKDDPSLGHITTFGGHPVAAAAGVATIETIQNSTLIEDTLKKEQLFRELLKHPMIREIRGKGLMLAAIVDSRELATKIIYRCIDKGLLLFFLLFEGKAIRITPPLTITKREITNGCKILTKVLEELSDSNTSLTISNGRQHN